MALARRLRLVARFPPLTHSLAIPARLLPTTLLAMLAGPIPTGRLPPRPSPGRLAAPFATVPRQRMMRRKPLLAPLHKTDPPTAMARALPPRRRATMLEMDHGRYRSRRSSPGSGVAYSAPGRFGCLPSRFLFLPVSLPLVQLNPLPAPSPLLPADLCLLWPPSRRDPLARAIPRRRRETGSLSSRYQHADSTGVATPGEGGKRKRVRRAYRPDGLGA